MLPKEVTDILEDVFGHFGDLKKEEVRKNPEACLMSLLSTIKEELPDSSRTLRYTVMGASYESSVEEAKKLLKTGKEKKKPKALVKSR